MTLSVRTVKGVRDSQLFAPIVLGITSEKINMDKVIPPAINASELISVRPNNSKELGPKITAA